jgi:hypothetical protein
MFGLRRKTLATPPKDAYFISVGEMQAMFAESKYLEMFRKVPELAIVINWKARAFSNIKLDFVSKETGKPVKNYEWIVKAFRKPNYFQNQQEFLKQSKIFRELYGNEIIYKLAPVGREKTIKALFSLCPENIVIDNGDVQNYWQYEDFPEQIKY